MGVRFSRWSRRTSTTLDARDLRNAVSDDLGHSYTRSASLPPSVSTYFENEKVTVPEADEVCTV
jgi:hypothetical protein